MSSAPVDGEHAVKPEGPLPRIVHRLSFPFSGADPQRLFAACVDPASLRVWFAEHVHVEPRVGGSYAFFGRHTPWVATPDLADQRVTRYEASAALAFSWRWRGRVGEVNLTFRPAPTGTAIDVHHAVEGFLLRDEQETRWAIGDFWQLSMGNLGEFVRSGRAALLPDFSETSPVVQLAIDIDAPPQRVFAALSAPGQLDAWIASKAQVELTPGGAYSYGWTVPHKGRPIACGPTRVLEIEPGRRLVTDWVHGDEAPSRVEWEVVPLAGGTRTRVTLVHRHADGAEPARSGYVQGWSAYLVRLAGFATARPLAAC